MIDGDGIDLEQMAAIIARQSSMIQDLVDIAEGRDEVQKEEIINIIGQMTSRWQVPFVRAELEEFNLDELEDLFKFVRRTGSPRIRIRDPRSDQRLFQETVRDRIISQLKIQITKQVVDLPYLELKYKKPILKKLSEYFTYFNDDSNSIRGKSKAIIAKGLQEAHQLMLNNGEPILKELDDQFKLTLENGDELLL